MFGLRQGFVPDCSGSRKRMPSSFKRGKYGSNIDLRHSASRNNVNLLSHERQGKDYADIFHLNHFMHKEGKIGQIIVGSYTCRYNFDAVDIVMHCRLNHIV